MQDQGCLGNAQQMGRMALVFSASARASKMEKRTARGGVRHRSGEGYDKETSCQPYPSNVRHIDDVPIISQDCLVQLTSTHPLYGLLMCQTIRLLSLLPFRMAQEDVGSFLAGCRSREDLRDFRAGSLASVVDEVEHTRLKRQLPRESIPDRACVSPRSGSMLFMVCTNRMEDTN